MSELTVCFYSGQDKPFKRGTILRNVMEGFEARGIRCTYTDAEIEPDVYIFEKIWHETRYVKPVIVHAENLIGDEAVRSHVFDRGDAIVFNSAWHRWLYFNTFGTELTRAYVIPPAHRARTRLERTAPDPEREQHIMCISKWWKRPFKRFPLIATAFDYLNRELGYPNAQLHVLGWLTDRPMPFVDTSPKLWKLKRGVRDNPNIVYHQKGFYDENYDEILAKTHIVFHPSPIDSGPQVVIEALSQGVPVVITNNMGAVEYVREIGPRAGRVVECDRVTQNYADIASLPLEDAKFCSDTSAHKELGHAMKAILDNYDFHRFEPPRHLTMDGIVDRWLAVVREVTEH